METPKPPKYRDAKCCGSCAHSRWVINESYMVCIKYNDYAVEESFVCDDFKDSQ